MESNFKISLILLLVFYICMGFAELVLDACTFKLQLQDCSSQSSKYSMEYGKLHSDICKAHSVDKTKVTEICLRFGWLYDNKYGHEAGNPNEEWCKNVESSAECMPDSSATSSDGEVNFNDKSVDIKCNVKYDSISYKNITGWKCKGNSDHLQVYYILKLGKSYAHEGVTYTILVTLTILATVFMVAILCATVYGCLNVRNSGRRQHGTQQNAPSPPKW